MKKYSILLGAAFSLFALASCQKEVDVNTPESESASKHVPFVLKADIPETRTTLDASTWEMAWETGDVIYAVTTDEEWGAPYSQANPNLESIAEFTYSNGGFTTTNTISSGEHTFNFLYMPADQKSFHRGASSTFQLYSSQTMNANDPTANLKNYDGLAGQVTATTPTTFVNVSMAHLFTIMKVTLKNRTGADITATKFEISATGANLNGVFSVSFGNTPAATYSKNGSNKITVNITNGSIANNGTLDVYFVMAPLTDYSGDITFSVTDSEGQSYSKTNSVTGVTLAAGTYNTASHTLKTPDPKGDWTLVTNASQISVGSFVVVAAKDSDKAMSQNQKTNNRGDADITKTGNTMTWDASSSDVQVFMVESGSAQGTYALKCAGGNLNGQYIYAASSSNNYLKTQTEVDANASWTISINNAGVASVVANGTNSRNYLQYNESSSLFACYASASQQSIVLYTGEYEYVAPKYKVEFSQPDTGGSISVKVNNSEITSGDSFESGTTVTIKATAETGYTFTSWSVNGATLADASLAETSFTIGNSNVTISATFTKEAVGNLVYTLDPVATGSNVAPHNAYAQAATATINGIEWSVTGNSSYVPWRIGGKSIENQDREIYSVNAISSNISQIKVTSGATASSLSVNSLTISVHNSSADAASGSNAIASKSFTSGIASNTVTFDKTDNTSWAGKYYRIVYNVTRTGSSGNGYITFEKAEFYGTN